MFTVEKADVDFFEVVDVDIDVFCFLDLGRSPSPSPLAAGASKHMATPAAVMARGRLLEMMSAPLITADIICEGYFRDRE